MFWKFCFFTFTMFLFLQVFGQRFGGNPPSIKWQQINTDTVRVIFQDGMEAEAKRVADISHYLSQKTNSTIGNEQRKINIVLQNQTTISNGYVGLAPWRSEFYMTAQQNSLVLGSLRWTDNLAIHEYRHVQQFMNFRKGLSKFAYFVAGEEGQSVANAAAVPDWFFEGDAVFQETAVSEQGRGRMPDFFNGYRSLWQADKKYSYMKLRNGSYRHFVPDHYQLGYLLVTHGRQLYGKDFWKNVTDDAARFKPLFYPFQNSVKRHSGKNFDDFVQAAIEFYKSELQRKGTNESGNALTGLHQNYVTDYQYPYPIGRDSILVLKKSYRQIAAWYILTGGTEKKIVTKDIGIDDYYSYRNGSIVYAAYETDPRWSWCDFSAIRIIDIRSGERRKITSKTKYFSPDISHDAKRIIAVEVKPGGKTALHLLETETGRLLKELPQADDMFYTFPRFSSDDQYIISAVRNRNGQMSLAKIDLQGLSYEYLIPFSWKAIANPYVYGDTVLFTASYQGRDEVIMLNKQMVYRVVSHYTGSYQPSLEPNSNSILYSRFTAGGMQLYRESIETSKGISLEEWSSVPLEVYSENALEQDGGELLSHIPQHDYKLARYKSGFRLFNFHSWRPYYDEPNWSFTVYSDNILNTFDTELYYSYNDNEQSHKLGYNGIFSAWYPWIVGGISYTFDRRVSDSARTITWNELNGNIGLRLPLNFSSGRNYKFLTLESSFNAEQLYFTRAYKDSFANLRFNYIESSIAWSMQTQKAIQHIYPRFAHTIYLQFRGTMGEYSAKQFLGNTSLYLPGVHVNHNLVLNAAYQARDTTGEYFFDNDFPFSRGYPGVDLPRMWKWGLNYHLPLLYPDWGFGQIVYFLRVRANAFFDHTTVKSLRTGTKTPLRSTGVELYFDTRWWNQQPVTFGVRYCRLLDADSYVNPPNVNRWEFIMPVLIL
jgi:hypothetical protein